MFSISPRAPRYVRTITLIMTIAVAAVGGILGQPMTATAAPIHISHAIKNVKPVKGSSAARVQPRQVTSSLSAPVIKQKFRTGIAYQVELQDGTAAKTRFRKATVVGTPSRISGPWRALSSTGISIAVTGTDLPSVPKSTPIHAPSLDATPPADSGKATLTILNRKDATKSGLSGFAMRLTISGMPSAKSGVALQIPDSLLNSVYGADFAARARWVEIQDASRSAGSKLTPVAFGHITSSHSTVVTPTVQAQTVTLAATGSPASSTGTGTFGSTPLNDASKWNVSAQTGDFTWTYTMRNPPAAAGPTPDLGLNYDSQSVDGETAGTNNQPSTIGDGWSLGGSGYISRQYVSCSEDGTAPTTAGDECWKQDNATISFAGHSGTLIKVTGTTGNSTWKLQSDDGSKFDYLTGTDCSNFSGNKNGTWDNDCWRMTATDGTKYYFGLDYLPGWTGTKTKTTNSAWTVPVFGDDSGEPCHGSTFTASSCNQAWRWNLDYVVDAHSNAEALYYNAETNHYQQYSASKTVIATYTRGGQLDHIDYGFKDGNAYATNAASDKVTFGYDAYGRCTHAPSTGATDASNYCKAEPLTGAAVSPSSATTYYPDVPFDQSCTSSTTCTQVSPTFWTTAMLDTVTTADLVGAAYPTVDQWSLCHSFPAAGDSSAVLWLTSVTRNGCATPRSTTALEPDTVFTPVQMQNRVNVNNDGKSVLDKERVASIQTSLGAVITVNYSAQQCVASDHDAIINSTSPEKNNKLCFPEWWTPSIVPAVPVTQDIFHKYVVTSVISNPETGGGRDASTETYYTYGQPSWRYNDSPFVLTKYRTWSEFAGFDTSEVVSGSASDPSSQRDTKDWYYQGMDNTGPGSGTPASVTVPDGPVVSDSLWFAGQVRESQTFNGSGSSKSLVSRTLNTPWTSNSTATDTSSWTVGDGTAVVTEPLAAGGYRTTTTKTSYSNSSGPWLPTTVETDHSDATNDCKTTSYAAMSTTGISGMPSEIQDVGTNCASVGSATYPAAAVSDIRYFYDNGANGTAASKGDLTETDIVDSYSGTDASSAHWTPSSKATFDGMGRPVTSTDILGNVSTTSYTPSATEVGKGALTSVTLTNQDGWKTTTAYNPAWGAPTSVTDANNHLTTAAYDSLGRRTGVWYADRPQTSHSSSPSVSYLYVLSQTSPNAVETVSTSPNGGIPSWTLFDGLGRSVQTQWPADGGGGTDVTDTSYDASGNTAATNATYWTNSISPSASLFVPVSESSVPAETLNRYDGDGRALSQTLYSYGAVESSATTTYVGADEADVTPAAGGTPTSTFSNSLGEITKTTEYLSATPNPGAGTETTTFGYDVRGNRILMVDPAGDTWTWKFDILGNELQAVDPDTGITTSTFDLAGNQLTQTDARGQVLAYKYDDQGRPVAEYSGSADANGSLLSTWSYDTASKGQRASSSSFSGSTPGHSGLEYKETVNSYDVDDRATSTTVTIPAGAPAFAGSSYTSTAQYNVGGTLASATYPAEGGLPAETVNYTYNNNGEVRDIDAGAMSVQMGYTSIGQLAQVDRLGSNEVLTSYAYDPGTGSVSRIKHTQYNGTTPTVLANSAYGYDASGEVTSIKTASDVLTSQNQCFTYDHLQNLQQAWTPSDGNCSAAPTTSNLGGLAPYWTSYAVDPKTGNRTSSTTNAIISGGASASANFTYPAAGSSGPHAVSEVKITGTNPAVNDYGYDAAGNTTSRPSQILAYDANGQVLSIKSGAEIQTDTYDADGESLLQSDTVTGSTLFLGPTELHVAAASSAVTATRTFDVGSIPIAEESETTGASAAKVTWLCADHQGTVGLQIDAGTGTLSTREQDPFGNAIGGPSQWTDGHGYLNSTSLSNLGLVQLGARLYDASIGRFLSVDPILKPQDPQSINGYSYADNSPISNSDPSGTNLPSDGGGGGGAGKSSEKQATSPEPKHTKSKSNSTHSEDWWNPWTWITTPGRTLVRWRPV